ncbi:MAG: aromatic aminobenezylarsenical efflux permease ArsG family transporter [Candidatus Omnitrophica bacterium]|nr:aromatic aminobenezylarsenical efflux permease ArsG family transporter [Candidatus Omnitrophota bacterium]
MIILTALWLGILTSISPCPLATNIAAVSFLSKRIAHPKTVFFSGIFYTIGRMLAYAILGFLIVKSALSVPLTANFLQKYMNRVLGPALIVTGLFLLDILKFNIPGLTISEKHQNKLVGSGIFGACILGFIFALSFCPVSAALFFGSLIPLALNHEYGLSLPLIYGVGTGIPVLVFAIGVALGITSLSRWFHKMVKLEIYARKITGVIFVAIGIYYISAYIVGAF